jgi:hypothetical protein
MLAKRRALRLDGQVDVDVRTPMLLPSFSSKGFPNVKKMFKAAEEYISDELLVSAYDVHYGLLDPPFEFASIVFLDSGGYEASKDTELSETFDREHISEDWTPDLYNEVIRDWTCTRPTIFVNFDSPKFRMTTGDQVASAKAVTLPAGPHGRELLIKPETEDSRRVHLKHVTPTIKEMSGFAAIGVTEKEVGNSVLTRMVNIATLRKALDEWHQDIPLHIFGSLDTLSTYLYFLAGADIFDGLTWLRYAFLDGDTIYRHSYGALTLPLDLNSDIVEGRCWSNNYQHMRTMRLNMLKFLKDGNFDHFGKHATLIKHAYDSMNASLEGG